MPSLNELARLGRQARKVAAFLGATVAGTASCVTAQGAGRGGEKPFIDSLRQALADRDTSRLASLLDPEFRIGPIAGPAARDMMMRAVGTSKSPPVSIRLDSTSRHDSLAVLYTTYAMADRERVVSFTLSSHGKLLETGLFQVTSTGTAGTGTGTLRAGPVGSASESSPATPQHVARDSTLRNRLLALREIDQRHRARIVELLRGATQGQMPPEADSLRKLQMALDAQALDTLTAIVRQRGWPTFSDVGEEAAISAFLIVQHSPLNYQEEFLPLVEKAATAGEARKADLALLTDRVLMLQGKKQRYGSQISRAKPGEPMTVWPIEDEANVDERRKSMGLGPLRDYLKNFGISYGRGAD